MTTSGVGGHKVHIDPTQFAHAARCVFDVKFDVENTVTELTSKLTEIHGKAGDDHAGLAFSRDYDNTVSGPDGILEAFTSFSAALRSVQHRLAVTGVNAHNAENHNHPHGQIQPMPTVAGDFVTPKVETIAGNGSTAHGLWAEVKRYATDIVWPAGNPENMFALREAWKHAGQRLDGQTHVLIEAKTHLAEQVTPYKPAMDTEIDNLIEGLQGCAQGCRNVGDMCHQYGDSINKTHEDIEDELLTNLGWSAGIQLLGLAGSVFTFGGSEVVAQTAQAAKIMHTANNIRTRIARFEKLTHEICNGLKTSCTRGRNILPKLRSIGKKTESFSQHMEKVNEQVIKNFKETKDARYEKYVKRKHAEGKDPLPQEEWEKRTETFDLSKAQGHHFEEYTKKHYNLTPEQGWKSQATHPDFPGRRLDFINEKDHMAIETKSGHLTPHTIEQQLNKDLNGLDNDWSVKWVLHEEPSPEVKAIFNYIKSQHPKFNYEILK